MEERLQKIIASAGITSRRNAEEMIENGRVRVNGKLVRELGVRADPDRDRIEVDGAAIHQPEKVYYMLHKPPRVLTSMSDPEGRPHVGEFTRRFRERIVPVGRLDWDSEGLLLLTNDGEAVYRLTHPKFGVLKTYHVKVKGMPTPEQIELLRRGVTVDGKRTGHNDIEFMKETRGKINSWWRVTINEGINRQIRKMFDRIEHPTQKLIRVAEGQLELGTLPRGAIRELEPSEVAYIKKLVKGGPGAAGSIAGPKKSSATRSSATADAPKRKVGARRGPRQAVEESGAKPARKGRSTGTTARKPRAAAPSGKKARTGGASEGPARKTAGRTTPRKKTEEKTARPRRTAAAERTRGRSDAPGRGGDRKRAPAGPRKPSGGGKRGR